jgi:hypothetical protein
MAIRSAVFTFAAIALAACQPAPQTPAAPPAGKPDASAEPLDPFVVMISAERWTVLLDKALEGTREASPSADETDQGRADRATRDGAAMLLTLRNQQCAKGLMKGDDCVIPNWPAWASEPPNPNTPLSVIDERSSWLGEVMQKYVDKGCETGKAALKDDMFCSVE